VVATVSLFGVAGLQWGHGGRPARAAESVAPDDPPKARILSVVDFGAKGDGGANYYDSYPIQQAVNAAKPGDTVYFPPAVYAIDKPVIVTSSNITLAGDGYNSVIKLVNAGRTLNGIQVGFDQQVKGVTITRLRFLGSPGRYLADGNQATGIQVTYGLNSVIEDCDFQGCGNAAYSVAPSYGTRIENCRVSGWGTVGFGTAGGDQILNCKLEQDDPYLGLDGNQRSSHGIYVHTGSHDVLVQDTFISNARKTGCQIYGETPGETIQRITFRRVTFKDCFGAFTIANYPGNASRAKDILLDECSFLGSYGGTSLLIKQGDGIEIRNCLIDTAPIGLGLGNWAPSEPNWGLITNLVGSGNTIRNCGTGMFILGSNGGRFEKVDLSNNTIEACTTRVYKKNADGVITPP